MKKKRDRKPCTHRIMICGQCDAEYCVECRAAVCPHEIVFLRDRDQREVAAL